MKLKLLGLSLLATVLLTGCGEIAQGTKVGQVVKVNEASGFFCKTVEVEIIRGGFNAGSGAMGGSLHFTIENNNKDLVDLVKKAMLDGSEVEVDYTQEFVSFCRSDSRNTFGSNVKLVKSTTTNTTVSGDDVTTEILKALKLQNEAIQKLLTK